MSEMLDKAVAALSEKFKDADLSGVMKFQIEGAGAIMVDAEQSPPAVSPGDGPADVTITAEADVFQDMLAGDLNPTMAYMSGKLKIDGDMGLAMKLAGALG